MAQCFGYRTDGNLIFRLGTKFLPCPSGLGCCVAGDTCLSNNICHFQHAQPSGFYSGYYISACVDPTFTSPSCPKQCTSLAFTDVVYNYTSNVWACCGTDASGSVSCNSPTDETFAAPAPADLSTLSSVTSGSTSALSSSSSSSASTTGLRATSSSPTQSISATESPSPPSARSTLSPGAKGGIAIAIVVGVLAVAIAAYALLQRHRKRVLSAPPAPSTYGRVQEHVKPTSSFITSTSASTVPHPYPIHEAYGTPRSTPFELAAR